MVSAEYVRVEWLTEEGTRIIADRIDGQWDFAEKDPWENTYPQLKATLPLIRRAEVELRQKQEAAQAIVNS